MRHPDKHIAEAIEYAESRGWRVMPSKGHPWAIIYCPLQPETDARCRSTRRRETPKTTPRIS